MEVVFPVENHYFGVPVRIFPAGKNQHRPAPKPTTKNKCWPCWVTRKASICFCFVACVVFWYAGFSQQGSVVHSYTHVSTFTKKNCYIISTFLRYLGQIAAAPAGLGGLTQPNSWHRLEGMSLMSSVCLSQHAQKSQTFLQLQTPALDESNSLSLCGVTMVSTGTFFWPLSSLRARLSLQTRSTEPADGGQR